jgi:hypothetical protein
LTALRGLEHQGGKPLHPIGFGYRNLSLQFRLGIRVVPEVRQLSRINGHFQGIH